MPILTPQERLGTTLGGKYRLERIIGHGGMGVVFEATHSWTERKVAIKLLHANYSQDEELGRRFLQEARTATAIRHPNVVEVLDMGQDEDAVYLALELLQGESLADVLKRSPLHPKAALDILLPVMAALTVAHRKGFIHRDLKPDNIFQHQDESGSFVPKLLDFGIAKVLQAGAGNMTQTGIVVGTPHYISPEQAIGSAGVGPQTDVWAMGVVAYECLSGAVPFTGDSPTEIVIKVVMQPVPPLSQRARDVPPAFSQVVERALQREVQHRYPDMRSFAVGLVEAARASRIEVDVPKGFLPGADITGQFASQSGQYASQSGSGPFPAVVPAVQTPMSFSGVDASSKKSQKPLVFIAAALVLLGVIVVGGGAAIWAVTQRSGGEAQPASAGVAESATAPRETEAPSETAAPSEAPALPARVEQPSPPPTANAPAAPTPTEAAPTPAPTEAPAPAAPTDSAPATNEEEPSGTDAPARRRRARPRFRSRW